MDDFVGVLCRARMSEREAIQLIVEMYRPLMLKYANLNTGFDDVLYQEFVCCVISCIFKFPFEKWNAENDLDSLSEKCDKVIKAGETYESFGGISDDMKGSVKFIIKTDSISK